MEGNPHNDNGTVVALYFEGDPTSDEVTAAAEAERGNLSLGLIHGEKAEFEVTPNPISERAKLVRVLVFNVG